MTRILHILPTLNPEAGGLSEAVRNIISYAASPGISHEVLCLDDPEANFLKQMTCPTHALGKGFSAWNYHPGLLDWLRQNLWTYHKVIVHGLWQYLSFAVSRVWTSARMEGAKLYVMPHGMLDPYFQRAKGRKLKAMRNVLFWQMVERLLVNNADGILFTTKTEALLAKDTFRPYRPKHTEVLGLGIKLPALPAHKAGSGYLLFLGRLHPKKGLDLLIRSYLILKSGQENLPGLVIAGPGLDTEYGKQMLLLAGGDRNIVFPGMLSGEAKWQAFQDCGAFVLPSHQENFGIAVVEALACGKPVLISDKVNISGDILESSAGLVAPDDIPGTIELLRCWISLSNSAKAELGENAGRLFEQKFTETVVAEKMVCFLKS